MYTVNKIIGFQCSKTQVSNLNWIWQYKALGDRFNTVHQRYCRFSTAKIITYFSFILLDYYAAPIATDSESVTFLFLKVRFKIYIYMNQI